MGLSDIEFVEVDIDQRLLELREMMFEVEEELLDYSFVSSLMRASFAHGYMTCVKDKGQLLEDHGYTREGEEKHASD